MLGGAFAIPVPASRWLLVCTLLLSSLLGFGKRAHELRVAGESGRAARRARRLRPDVLRALLTVLGVAHDASPTSPYTALAHAELFGTASSS